MNIVFVNRMIGLTRGGGEIWDLQVAEKFRVMGNEVSFCVGKPLFKPLTDPIERFRTTEVPSPHLQEVAYRAPRGIGGVLEDIDSQCFTRRVASRLANDECDVIHVTGDPRFGRVVNRFPCPVVITMHALPHSFFHDTLNPFSSSYDFLSAFDAITAVGETATALQERIDTDVTRIDPGVDTEQFAPAEINKSGDSFRVLFVGRFVPVKNLTLLLKSFATLHNRHPDTELVLVGNGPLRQRLETTAQNLGIRDAVSFVGYVAHEDLVDWYQQADVFTLSSKSENYPLVLLEAMGCGIPAVAPDVGSVTEIIRSGKTGLIFPEGSKEKLTDQLQRLYEDRNYRTELGKRAREQVTGEFSWKKRAEHLYEVFDSVSV